MSTELLHTDRLYAINKEDKIKQQQIYNQVYIMNIINDIIDNGDVRESKKKNNSLIYVLIQILS